MAHIIVGTAGHIDHGKTALVKALTGIDADRLKEEKERGITIDIGFANLALDAETTLGFVDVPGHERFIKNMLAGAAGIDMVMLVVAADESVMPQTREHLDICSLLRVDRGVVVLTKIDAAERELADLAEMEVQELVRGTVLEGAPIVRVSSRTGEGIPRLVEILRDHARLATPRDAARLLRLPIDRAFTVKGFGTVVSGTLIAGRVGRDEEVEILPGKHAARVRGIQVHGAAVEEARAGQRTALNLQRIELAEVERGMVVAAPGAFEASRMFDVDVQLLPSAPGPIVRRKRVRFHTGTAEVIGFLVLLGQDSLEPGGSALAQVRLEAPAFALPGDRFIIRQYSPMVTLGGGEILDLPGARHRRSDAVARTRLERLQRASLEERIVLMAEELGDSTLSAATIIARAGVPHEAARNALAATAASGRLRLLSDTPPTAVAAAVFEGAAGRVLEEVRRFHEREPLARGIAREDLKGRAARHASPVLFRAVLEHLEASRQLALDQEIVHLHDRTVTLGGEDARVLALLEDRFQALGLQAPAPDDVIATLGVPRAPARKLLQLMVRDGLLVKVNEQMMVSRAAIDRLVADVRALKSRTTTFGVREFKELTGLSRKFAVPLLEYLDSQRVTRRTGDERIIL